MQNSAESSSVAGTEARREHPLIEQFFATAQASTAEAAFAELVTAAKALSDAYELRSVVLSMVNLAWVFHNTGREELAKQTIAMAEKVAPGLVELVDPGVFRKSATALTHGMSPQTSLNALAPRKGKGAGLGRKI